MNNVTKEYLIDQYKLAVSDFKIAHNEDEQFEARNRMANLEKMAAESFGFDFCDELHEYSNELRK